MIDGEERMSLLLSICIPTYNRISELSELIDLLLTIERDDFEIVITDNQSTDNTRQVLLSYTDKRLRYCCNDEAIPALLNMIHSIYNGKGKYVLYCNDRDILYPNEVVQLMEILEKDDYSFIHSTRHSEYCSQKLDVFNKEYESLINQHCNRHPSGMVFNRKLMEEHIDENIFGDYLQYIYTYDFLMLELFKYEKSAFYHCGYWGTRPVSYLRDHKAGTGPNLYFLPENREKTFYGIIDFIFGRNRFHLQLHEKQQVAKALYMHFAVLFCNYKLCLADVNETAHYGVERKHISTSEMIKIYKGFFYRSLERIKQEEDGEKIANYVKKQKIHLSICVIKSCIKIDILNCIKFLNGSQI